jgi:DNA relaxase NicK
MNAALQLLENKLNISYPLPSSRDKQKPVYPYSNTGERSTEEELVQASTEKAQIAFIDFLTVVIPARDIFRFDKFSGLDDFAHAIQHYFLECLGFNYDADMKAGRNGYKNHWKILVKTHDKKLETVGFFAFGGNNDTICITLTGVACQTIDQAGFSFIRSFIEELKGKITRIDLAHDCLEGEVNLKTVREWYDTGLFRSSSRGKYPDCQFIDDCGSGKGCTLYVGSRESGKYFRAYEKGKQLGDKTSPWVRLELEILSKKRGIPYEILDNVSRYLAGGYNCLEYLSKEQSKIKTLQKSEQISYHHLETYAKQSYGRFIDVMLQVYDGCPELVVEQLRRDDALPSRLIPASIPVRQ